MLNPNRLFLSISLAAGCITGLVAQADALPGVGLGDVSANSCYVCKDRSWHPLQYDPVCSLSRGNAKGHPDCAVYYVIKPTTENGQETLECIFSHGPCSDGRSKARLGGLFGY